MLNVVNAIISLPFKVEFLRLSFNMWIAEIITLEPKHGSELLFSKVVMRRKSSQQFLPQRQRYYKLPFLFLADTSSLLSLCRKSQKSYFKTGLVPVHILVGQNIKIKFRAYPMSYNAICTLCLLRRKIDFCTCGYN